MTPITDKEACREAFEAWASRFKGTRDEFNLEKNEKGEYKWAVADMVWRAWSARAADTEGLVARLNSRAALAQKEGDTHKDEFSHGLAAGLKEAVHEIRQHGAKG